MLNLRKSIGVRIAKLVAISTFVTVLFAATAFTYLRVSSEIDSRRAGLEATAYALASAAGEAVVDNDRHRALAALTAVSRVPNIDMASIVTKNGDTLASMGNLAYLLDDVVNSNDGKWSFIYKGKLPISVDIIKGGVIIGKLIIVTDIRSLRSQILYTVLTTFAAAIVVALAGVFASQPLQLRIVGPLTKLTQTIQALRSSRDYSVGLEDDNTPDETGVLVKAFNGLMSDIRFRDQALQRLAYHDPLTGLPNRVSFQKSLADWIERPFENPTGAVALLNIRGFRALNDAFSHSIGDAILMTVAANIKATLPEGATLARYGGDEFAVLLPNADNEAAVEMSISRINMAFSKPIKIGELELHVTLTAGAVTIFGQELGHVSTDEVLRHSDLALDVAKKQTAGSLQFFRAPMSEQVQQDTTLGQYLRQAAMLGEFSLHFQAQLDLKTNRVSGFEALARWRHAELGDISPAIFIPMAERIGLIGVIGDWVLAEGCRQAASWLRQGQPERSISINASPAQILAAGFVEKVRRALKNTGLPPRLLCIELTESMFIGSNYAETVIVLETLAKDGITLALDDFGTGYSSLSYLSKLPFHIIKIDRAFVSHANTTPRKTGMLKSIVEMVHSLGMTTVAEGAETAEEATLLQNLGVNKVQGYIVAKPMPAAEALARANQIEARYQKRSA